MVIHDILIDENGNQIYSDKVINIMQIELNNGECSFEINKHMASYLSSIYEKDKVDYRGFRMIDSWGENECEYGFIAGTKENIEVREISKEERQRLKIYIEVMKVAFSEENGGDSFLAVKFDTLEGLNNDAKEIVMEELKSLSPNIYQLEDVENDSTRFEMDSNGMLMRTLDGTLLWVGLKEYSEDKAEITGVSWFGNLGAVFPTYEAIYINGVWKLKLLSMVVS